jgi:arsenate reductase-like glutaredoxin family protein
VREFLARNKVDHAFTDVRKAPLDPAATVALVRRHRRALSKRGATVLEVAVAEATDAELEKLFLGREGTLRAPTISVGDTIFAGFDAAHFQKLVLGK